MVETCWNNKMFNNHSTRFNGMSPSKNTIVCEGLACLILCKLHTGSTGTWRQLWETFALAAGGIPLSFKMLQPQISAHRLQITWDTPNFDASISIFISGGKTRFKAGWIRGTSTLQHSSKGRWDLFHLAMEITLKRKGEKKPWNLLNDDHTGSWRQHSRRWNLIARCLCVILGPSYPPPVFNHRNICPLLAKKSPKGFLFSIQHYQCALSFSKQYTKYLKSIGSASQNNYTFQWNLLIQNHLAKGWQN